MKLISLMPLNIREAEKKKDEKPADDKEAGGENPFAAADDEGGDTEEVDAEGGADPAAEEGGEDKAKTSDEAKPLEIVFDPSRVRKYNENSFKGNRGVVTTISKYGMGVTLPDNKTIFVNFEDIL
jgi:hypothetical protein